MKEMKYRCTECGAMWTYKFLHKQRMVKFIVDANIACSFQVKCISCKHEAVTYRSAETMALFDSLWHDRTNFLKDFDGKTEI